MFVPYLQGTLGTFGVGLPTKRQQLMSTQELLTAHNWTRMSGNISSTGGPVYFFREYEHPYGFLSQWFDAPFTAPSGVPDTESMTFKTTEQYMMYHKAILFNDADIAHQIMLAKLPKEHKALGRKVKNFNGDIWEAHREKIVEQGNWNKFCSSNEGSKWRDMLLKTGDRELVEVGNVRSFVVCIVDQTGQASPFDR
ncbi:MAG: hypothetical protein Q9192_004184 [Flavoplaca navasiana]